MSSTSPSVVGTAAVSSAPSTRVRLLTFLVTIAVAVAALATPQLTSTASARSLPKNSYGAKYFALNMLHMMNRERRAHGLPKLVIEADGKPVKAAAYGPLLSGSAGARIGADLKRWTGGSDACAA